MTLSTDSDLHQRKVSGANDVQVPKIVQVYKAFLFQM